MENVKKMFPSLIVILLGFYLLPFGIKDTGSGMSILLIITPIVVFICSIVYGIKNDLNPLYALIVAVLFIPAILIFYNSSAWVYVLGYGIVAFIGNALGKLFRR